jgi:teichuronic acid biosynthesis glycosyltransferase TuaH
MVLQNDPAETKAGLDHSLMKGRDIVIIGLQAWYTDIGSNCKNIALELSRHNRVLYINMPLDRKTIARQKSDPNIQRHLQIIRNKADGLVEVGPNLWNYYPSCILESINWIPFTSIFSIFNRINNQRFAKQIAQAASRLGFAPYILFNDNDIFRSFYLKELLKPELYIYYSRDNLLGVPYWRKHGKTIEPAHIAKADIAMANSLYLRDYLRKYNPNSYYIGQGCDISLFDADKKYLVPEDLKKLGRPVIGFVGSINTIRINAAVIRIIARDRPSWNIVMIGPEDPFFAGSDLHQIPNIHFLGKKPISSLPGYISAFDVCINPQLVNEVTIGNYPLKVDEYLALGKPVVATSTKAMEIFGDQVAVARQPEEFTALIEKALGEDTASLRKKRIDLARTHTWEESVKQFQLAILKTELS